MNSGDHNMHVPFLGTQACIRYLNYSLTDYGRPWTIGVYMSSFDSLCFGRYTRTWYQ